jgi:predicted AlkP superfamily phosphohydrolase/phosphomutase
MQISPLQKPLAVIGSTAARGFLAAIGSIVIVAVTLAAVAGCAGNDGAKVENAAAPPTRTFQTWQEFLDHPQPDRRETVVFIGLDGATWSLIDPLIEQGMLPTFARLKNEGAWGVLRSTQTYISPPAWTTMMTGFLPERTGIYSFGHWTPEQKRFVPLSSTDIAVPALWDITSLAGKRTAVVNMPVTYPVREVNGIMVSGLLTPMRLDDRQALPLNMAPYKGDDAPRELDRSFSPLLYAKLDHHGNTFEFFLGDTRDDKAPTYDAVYMRIESGDGVSGQHLNIAQYSPWVKIDVQTEDGPNKGWCRIGVLPTQNSSRYVARFSHLLWSSQDSDVEFAYPQGLADDIHARFPHYFPSTYLDRELVPEHAADFAQYSSFFLDYDDWDLYLFVFTQTDNILHADGMAPLAHAVFKTIDAYLATLLDKLPESTNLILASDHGFGECDFSIDLNRIFEQLQLTTYKDAKKLDFDRTIAFHNLWSIYFNESLLTRHELSRRGIPFNRNESPREALIRYIDESAGEFLQRKGVRLEFTEVPPGAVGEAPDLLVKGTYENHQIEMWNLDKSRKDIVTRLAGSARWFHEGKGFICFTVQARSVACRQRRRISRISRRRSCTCSAFHHRPMLTGT